MLLRNAGKLHLFYFKRTRVEINSSCVSTKGVWFCVVIDTYSIKHLPAWLSFVSLGMANISGNSGNNQANTGWYNSLTPRKMLHSSAFTCSQFYDKNTTNILCLGNSITDDRLIAINVREANFWHAADFAVWLQVQRTWNAHARQMAQYWFWTANAVDGRPDSSFWLLLSTVKERLSSVEGPQIVNRCWTGKLPRMFSMTSFA